MMRGNAFATGIIAGALAGVVAGLLLAPKPGKVTRGIVRDRAGSFGSAVRKRIRRVRAANGTAEYADSHAEAGD